MLPTSFQSQHKALKAEPRTLETLAQEVHNTLAIQQNNSLSAPVLPSSRSNGHLSLDTDAFDRQTGCVLVKNQPDGMRYLLSYWSRAMHLAEQSCDTPHREPLTKVCTLLILRPFLEHHKFIIHRDQYAVK